MNNLFNILNYYLGKNVEILLIIFKIYLLVYIFK